MATTVHIPKPLLAAVDRRARELRVSRNRLIVQALEREVHGGDWSPGFFQRLRNPEPGIASAVDEMLAAVRSGRRSKSPLRL